MRIQGVLRLVGQVVILFSLFLLLPHMAGFLLGQRDWVFLHACLAGLVLGGGLIYMGRKQDYFTVRDGFLTVTLIWLICIVIGALPFVMGQVLPSWLDALLESTSGLTTTGFSIIEDVDQLPLAYVVWRSLLHWLGGLGIVVLLVGFIKSLGSQSSHFFYAESSISGNASLIPRVREIARHLFYVYTLITLACIGALSLAGMPLFEAFNYALSVMGAGGFAPTSDGAMIYGNQPFIEWILILFMVLAGGNFSLYVLCIRRRRLSLLWQNSEMRFYWLLLALGAFALILCLGFTDTSLDLGQVLSKGAFMYVSMQTGTGLAVADYTDWFLGAQAILFIATFLGGCSGSMTGGIKMSRLLILWRDMMRHLKLGAHPDAIISVRINGQVVDQRSIDRSYQFFFLYLVIYAISVLLLTASDMTIENALGLSAGMLGNVGLAFADYGPSGSLGDLSDFSKCICILDMILGRLELFTVLVLFMPSFWKGYLHK